MRSAYTSIASAKSAVLPLIKKPVHELAHASKLKRNATRSPLATFSARAVVEPGLASPSSLEVLGAKSPSLASEGFATKSVCCLDKRGCSSHFTG